MATPHWAPQDRHRWPAGCTPHRDGWVRFYKGQTRFVCGRRTPLNEVADRWIEKKRKVDGEIVAADETMGITLRQLTVDFLAAMKARVASGKPRPMSERTYHNYVTILNDFGCFIGGDVLAQDIGPKALSAYAERFSKWKASGFDSVVCRVSALFRWAERMEYIDRFRPGPQFVRPPKQDIRDDRLDKVHSLTPEQIARLWHRANHTMQCWIALGVCGGFSNSDIAHMPRQVIDLEAGVIDYRRRKKGRVRRIIILPDDVGCLMRQYHRPSPADDAFASLFFLTARGHPYAGTRTGKPGSTISRLFAKLCVAADVEGKSFRGLRTTLYNLWPRDLDLERKIVMGRAQGTVDLDHYLETIGLERLRHGVGHVWNQIKTAHRNLQAQQPSSAAASSSEREGTNGGEAASPRPQTA